jgi:hypothetical protein
MKKSLTIISAILLASLLLYAAGLAGTWNLQGGSSSAPQKLVFAVSGNSLSGTLDGQPITGGAKGTDFWFNATRNGAAYQYKGTLNGDSLQLVESVHNQSNTYTYTRAGA